MGDLHYEMTAEELESAEAVIDQLREQIKLDERKRVLLAEQLETARRRVGDLEAGMGDGE